MPSVKRLRIIAGPNGSGKSTFVYSVKKNPPVASFKLGYFVNADEIEKGLKETKTLKFGQFGLTISTKQIQDYFKKSTFAPVKLNSPDLWTAFEVEKNVLVVGKIKINSYVAADIAEFIRQELVKSQQSFSYETVMSDKKKISFLKKAKKSGYKIYLYYFATEDPLININRVKIRVEQKGHKVNSGVVEKRYYKSLNNLKSAIKISDRAYLFDNTSLSYLYAEIVNGNEVRLIDTKNIPNWFMKYVVEK